MVKLTRNEYRIVAAVRPCIYKRRATEYEPKTAREMYHIQFDFWMRAILVLQCLALSFVLIWLFAFHYGAMELSIISGGAAALLITYIPQHIYDAVVIQAYRREKLTRQRRADNLDES